MAFLFLALSAAGFWGTSPLQASHFRFAHLTWRRLSENTVEFTSLQAWRAGADETLSVHFGDGDSGIGQVTEVSTGRDSAGELFVVNRYTVEHTYPSEGPFTAFFDGCCRL